MMDDAGYIIDKTIDESRKEMFKLRKISRQIDNYKRIASSKKTNKDKLVKTLEFAKRALIDTLQSELSSTIESAETKDKVREDTIKQLIHFLKENELHIPKSEDWTEPAIYISVLQSLTKKCKIIYMPYVNSLIKPPKHL